MNLCSSQMARIASWILREIVRSCVRNRFLASCWVSVEPPCMPPRPDDIAQQRAADALRIDAPMRIEAAVLDGDEGLGQIGRQLGDADRGAAGVAAIGEQRPVRAHDRDIGRTFGHGELVDGRQLRAVIDHERAAADHAPDAERQRPIEKAADQRAGAPLWLRSGARARRPARLRPEIVVIVLVEPGFPAIAVARHSTPAPRLPPSLRVSDSP